MARARPSIYFRPCVRVRVMIEILMVFSLGFLTAILLTLAVIPFVHSRAERLAIERVEASIPISIAEVHAGKDILRAEFAMSTRRQELAIEHLRSKMMAYARELGRKTTVTGRPQSEIIGATASLEDGSLHSTGDKSSIAIGRRRENKDVVGEKEAEITRLKRELDERSRTSDAQRVELVALKIRIEALNRQLPDSGKRRVQEQIGAAGPRGGLRLAG